MSHCVFAARSRRIIKSNRPNKSGNIFGVTGGQKWYRGLEVAGDLECAAW